MSLRPSSSSSQQTTRRLLLELRDVQQSFDSGENGTATTSDLKLLRPVSDDDLFLWEAKIRGPSGTVFQNVILRLSIKVPPNYPLQPPMINFQPGIVCHPNVDRKTGAICLSLLSSTSNHWSPAWTLRSACLAVQALLGDLGEGVDSPLDVDVANLVRCGDLVAYESLATMWLELSDVEKVRWDADEPVGKGVCY